MRRLVLALVLATLVAGVAHAEPPSGFAEFPWGTSPQVLREQLLTKRCRTTTESWRGWRSLQCQDYVAGALSASILRLDFEPPDSLAGYYMTVPRASYRGFRDMVVQRFGPPTSQRSPFFQGTTMSWTSDAVAATLIERCGPDIACLEVRTAPLERKRQQILERERRDSMQGF
jgi:hypothetical protein